MTMFDPFRDFEALRREIDRAFAEAGLGPLGHRPRQAFLPGRAARQYPLVNVHDDGETFVVEALAHPQSCRVARRAPSAMAWNLAHMTVGCTSGW